VFVVDELDALGAIDGLKDALARLRKFGCRCVLGFQSIAQVSSTYGQSDAQTLVENCGNTLILRCSSSENGGTGAIRVPAHRRPGNPTNTTVSRRDRDVCCWHVAAKVAQLHRAAQHRRGFVLGAEQLPIYAVT